MTSYQFRGLSVKGIFQEQTAGVIINGTLTEARGLCALMGLLTLPSFNVVLRVLASFMRK